MVNAQKFYEPANTAASDLYFSIKSSIVVLMEQKKMFS